MTESNSSNSNASVEADVLDAIRAYNDAFKNRDIDGQIAFYGDTWHSTTGLTKAQLRNHLQTQLENDEYEEKHFVLDDAIVEIEGDTATVDRLPLRSPTGNGTFTFQMQKDDDGAWRCESMFLSKSPDLHAEHARAVRERITIDPSRPGYHFVNPEGIAMPFDPNGAIYWNGRYHLFYIFQDSRTGERADHWGHVSSTDLFHWHHHPTGLVDGMYSGNCFLNREGVPTMCYHQKGIGNALAVALDDDLNEWQKLDSNPITPTTAEGDPHHGRYRSWDPYGWVENDQYYAIFGGKQPAIAKSPEMAGEWKYVGDLFAHGVEGISLEEDVSCPDLFKLRNKHVLLCISHRMGCRYYLGDWKDEQFYPESHAQMSWVDNTFFAPESLVDDKERRIMWSWLMDEPEFAVRSQFGWSGTLSLPRVLWLDDDGFLCMDVPSEIESLRYDGIRKRDIMLQNNTEITFDDIQGSSLELQIELSGSTNASYGVKVCVSPDGREETTIYYDATQKQLKVDTQRSGPENTPQVVESAPFELKGAETLKLRIFVDKSVVEVFANQRQAITRRIYPERSDSIGTRVFSNDGDARIHALDAWQITPTNSY